jgi:hypothetical protein
MIWLGNLAAHRLPQVKATHPADYMVSRRTQSALVHLRLSLVKPDVGRSINKKKPTWPSTPWGLDHVGFFR